MPDDQEQDRHSRFGRLRTRLFWIFILGTVGATAELLFLEHFEPPWQPIPLTVLALSLIGMTIARRSRQGSARFARVLMLLLVIAGTGGLTLHLRGNLEFERELYPNRGSMMLFWGAMKGATPALAPGTLIVLGLLGWAYLDHGGDKGE